MKWCMLTSNILSLIKRNIPSICTVLILSSPEPRKRRGGRGGGGGMVIYACCPALLIGFLSRSLWDHCFFLLHSHGQGCAESRKAQQAAWEGPAEHTVGPSSASGKWYETL